MNDERLEAELRTLLREDAPKSAPALLRLRAAAVPQEVQAGPRGGPAPRLLAAAGSLAAVVVVAAVVMVTMLQSPRRGSVPGSPLPVSPSAAAPTPAAFGSPTPVASAEATPAGTLPFRVAAGGIAVRASDGTLYVATSPWGATGQGNVYALDPAGRVKPGWPFAPPGVVAFRAPVIGPDGTAYVLGWGYGPAPTDASTNASWLWALDPSGHVKSGWPHTIEGAGFGLAVSQSVLADGTVVITESVPSSNGSPSHVQAVALGIDGRVRAGWPVTLPGQLVCAADPCFSFGDDGTWYAMASVGENGPAEIVALRPDGSPKPGWPVRVPGGEGFSLGSNGLVYAWGVDTNGVQPGHSPGPKIVQTHFLVLGPDGSPHPGWPMTLDGPASPPAIGQDGTLYITTGGEVGQVQRLLAIAPDGHVRMGWPYTLPADIRAWGYGYGAGNPPRLAPPTIGLDGTAYLAVHRASDPMNDGLLVVAPDGSERPGWPVWLPHGDSFAVDSGFAVGGGSMVAPAIGSDGSVYVAVRTAGGSGVVALDQAGRDRSGWPFLIAGGPTAVIGVLLAPDTTLYVTAVTRGGITELYALQPDGMLAP
jgi:hypothetical protein